MALNQSCLKINNASPEMAEEKEKDEERKVVVIVNDLYEDNLVDLNNYARRHGLSQIKTVSGDASQLGKNQKFLTFVDDDPRGKLTAIVASNLFHYMHPQQTIDTLTASREWLAPREGRIFMSQGNINSIARIPLHSGPLITKIFALQGISGGFSKEHGELLVNHIKKRHLDFLNDSVLDFYFLNDDVSRYCDLFNSPPRIQNPFWVATHDKWKEIVEICGYSVITHTMSTDAKTAKDSKTNIVAAPTNQLSESLVNLEKLKLKIRIYNDMVDAVYHKKKWQFAKFGPGVAIILAITEQDAPAYDEREYVMTDKRTDKRMRQTGD